MAEIPSVEQAHIDLIRQVGGAIGHPGIGVQVKTAVLAAAVEIETAKLTADVQMKAIEAQRETAAVMSGASDALRTSIDRFTEASNRGTDELAKWTRSTARWTRALVFVTVALVIAAIVQIVIMWKSGTG